MQQQQIIAAAKGIKQSAPMKAFRKSKMGKVMPKKRKM